MNQKRTVHCGRNLVGLLVASAAAGGCTEPRELEMAHLDVDPAFELEQRAVFGEDDRLNYDEIDNPAIRRVADAVAAIVPEGAMECDEEECIVTRVIDKARRRYFFDPVIDEAFKLEPLCEDARFRGQSQASVCTAFLLEPDLLLTAGHCLNSSSWLPDPCSDARFVFGYTSSETFAPATKILQRDVYRCKEILQRLVTKPANGPHTKDWAFVRLDRPVLDRRPIGLVRLEGQPSSDRLILVGHPDGLTQKIAVNGKVVTDIPGRSTFTADLDSSSGNSGGPVIGPDGTVEGILIGGAIQHFSLDLENQCLREAMCREGDYYRPICEVDGRLSLSRYSIVLRMPAVLDGLKCSNGVRDEGEGDVDCGGACAPCPDGSACSVGSDCDSSVCVEGSCVPPNCSDRVQNQRETKIDWGGPCERTEEGYLIETLQNDERWVFGREDKGFGGPRWEVGSGVLSNSFYVSSFGQLESGVASSVRTILEVATGPHSNRIEFEWSAEHTLLGWGLPDTQIRVVMTPFQCGPGSEPQEETLFVPRLGPGRSSFRSESFRLSRLQGANVSKSCLFELKFEVQPRMRSSIFGMLWGRVQIREIRITPGQSD